LLKIGLATELKLAVLSLTVFQPMIVPAWLAHDFWVSCSRREETMLTAMSPLKEFFVLVSQDHSFVLSPSTLAHSCKCHPSQVICLRSDSLCCENSAFPVAIARRAAAA
jgi:hypothetical protein